MSLNAKLVVVGGDVKTTEIKLKLPSTIGRGRGTSIVLPHPLISRQHCELYEAGGQLMVRDLGSLNGTFVNNQRVTESAIAPGELLTVGTVTFRAVYEAAMPGGGGAAGPKAGKSDKTVRDEKTVQAKATTRAAQPKPEPAKSDSEVLQFDFDQPLFQADENSQNVTERLDASSQKKPAKSGPAKNAEPPKKPAAKSPPAEQDDEVEKASHSSSEDDLNDFLESLEDR